MFSPGGTVDKIFTGGAGKNGATIAVSPRGPTPQLSSLLHALYSSCPQEAGSSSGSQSMHGCPVNWMLFAQCTRSSPLKNSHFGLTATKSWRRIKTEENAKVVAAAYWFGDWGTYVNAAITIKQQGRFKQKILGEHPFWKGGGLVWIWTGWSSIFSKHPFRKEAVILLSFSSNHPGGKKLVRQGIESIPSPK